MAKEKANVNTIYIGAVGGANPPTTPGKVLNKRNVKVSIKNQTDDATTDDSAAPEIMTIYAGDIRSVAFNQLVDTSDASYDFLRQRLEDGAAFLVCWRPDGDGSPKRQGVVQMVVSRDDSRDPQKIGEVAWSLESNGDTTWTNQ